MSDAVDDPHPNPNRDGFDARTVALGDVQPVGRATPVGARQSRSSATSRSRAPPTALSSRSTATRSSNAGGLRPPVSTRTRPVGRLHRDVPGRHSGRGTVRSRRRSLPDPTDGTVRFRMETRDDVGGPQRETRFFLPFVVDIVGDGERAYVAARRYERDGDDRSFHSVVFALDAHGARAWTYETDASVIALDARDDRLGVAHNRCPGDDQHGLVVLDAESGRRRFDWDPGTEGQRRIGDVALVADGAVVASHGDKRGYRLTDGGACAGASTSPRPPSSTTDAVRVPNHVHAADDGVVFVTGNTYPEDGRETDGRHPTSTPQSACPRMAIGGGTPTSAGSRRLAAAGDRVVVPGAQHFRDRDADDHGLPRARRRRRPGRRPRDRRHRHRGRHGRRRRRRDRGTGRLPRRRHRGAARTGCTGSVWGEGRIDCTCSGGREWSADRSCRDSVTR